MTLNSRSYKLILSEEYEDFVERLSRRPTIPSSMM